jgi:hypothetical protein
MKNKFYILILLVVTLIFGCATPRMYEGPKLLKEQVASIKVSRSHWLYFPPTFFGVSGIDVLGTEDKEINSLVNKLITRIEVLPGFHKVFVQVRKEVWAGSNWTGPMQLYETHQNLYLEFSAEAGHKYKIKVPYWWKKGSLIRVVDVGSGEVVASETIK